MDRFRTLPRDSWGAEKEGVSTRYRGAPPPLQRLLRLFSQLRHKFGDATGERCPPANCRAGLSSCRLGRSQHIGKGGTQQPISIFRSTRGFPTPTRDRSGSLASPLTLRSSRNLPVDSNCSRTVGSWSEHSPGWAPIAAFPRTMKSNPDIPKPSFI